MKLALFDLDHTLLPLDSDHAFGEFMVSLGWVDGAEHRRRNDAFFQSYREGRLDLARYIDFATAPWRRRSESELAHAQARFMREIIEPVLRPAAQDLLDWHRRRGDLIAIVTATNRFVTAPIARAFGVEHLLAIELARDAAGRVDGRIAGTPSYREGKVTRVDEWLAGLGLAWADFAHTVFYSDSINDLALLERVDEPVATNPSPELAALAASRRWRILHLFT